MELIYEIPIKQEFLLESIRKVPELVESKTQMTKQIEIEENEISEKNKIFSTQEEKIKSMEIESKGNFQSNFLILVVFKVYSLEFESYFLDQLYHITYMI